MAAEYFFDTNVLLYAYDLDSAAKRSVAKSLLEAAWRQPRRFAISVQVLQEFHVNFVRRGRPVAEPTELTADFASWPIVDNSLEVLRLGLKLQVRWQLSLWDAMILSAAQTSSARELLSEDFNHGQDYGGVRVVNPFLRVS